MMHMNTRKLPRFTKRVETVDHQNTVLMDWI